jgi:LCP family protein required for cell wall assembly
MGKYEAAAGRPQGKSGRQKKKGRTGLIIGLIAVTLIGAAFLWLVTPPAAPKHPDDTGNRPTTPATDGSGNTVATVPPVPEGKKVQRQGVYTFLVMGTNDGYNTDVIMLVKLDISGAKPDVDIVSIPRDSMVDYESPIKRINGVMGYFGFAKDSAVEEMKNVVEQVTGVYSNYHCIIDLDAFLQIVDVVGGVVFNVPQRMYHPDADTSQTIDLKKGEQTLTSKKAIQLVRYRGYTGGDLERINTQKDFLTALIRTVLDKFSITTFPDILDTVFSSIRTDMTFQNMVSFAVNGLYPMDIETGLMFHTMPISHMGKYNSGKYGSQDYIYLDEAAIPEFINGTVNPYERDIEKNDFHIIALEN